MDSPEETVARMTEAQKTEYLALEENIRLRCLLGGGCDANNDGPHSCTGSGKSQFCTRCGENTINGKSKPWFDDARLDRTKARILEKTS